MPAKKAKKVTKKVKPFVLKNINAKDFEALLDNEGACHTARKWAKGKSLKQVWKACHRPDWLNWLLYRMTESNESDWYCTTKPVKVVKAWGGRKRVVDIQKHAYVKAWKQYRGNNEEAYATSKYSTDSVHVSNIDAVKSDFYRERYVVE